VRFLDYIIACNDHDKNAFLPWFVDDQKLGFIPRSLKDRVSGFDQLFHPLEDGLGYRLDPNLKSHHARSEAVEACFEPLAGKEELGPWRGEKVDVAPTFHHPALLTIERCFQSLLGIRAHGVHLNGYVIKDNRTFMWIGRRSPHIKTFPNELDNIVAGGHATGLRPVETLQKECEEEAAIPLDLSAQARPVGVVTYMKQLGGLRRDTLFCYDLLLPEGFQPVNTDGEVAAFMLWPIEQVMEALLQDANFKFNVPLVILDFLIRHGHITPDHSDYLPLVHGLRQAL